MILENLYNSITHALCDFSMTNNGKDGRVQSAVEEEPLIDHLIARGIPLVKSPSRYWFDGGLQCDGICHPANIKMTTMKGNDNAANKEMLLWGFTDMFCEPTIEGLENFKVEGYNECTEILNTRFCKEDNGRDYYYIVYNKTSPHDSFVTSLKQLQEVTSCHWKNWGFQVPWKRNKIRISNRTYYETSQLIFKAYFETIKKGQEYFNSQSKFEQTFNETFK